jgi:hypothetical protein
MKRLSGVNHGRSKSRDSPHDIRDGIIHIAILRDTRMSPLRPPPIPCILMGEPLLLRHLPRQVTKLGSGRSFRFGWEWIYYSACLLESCQLPPGARDVSVSVRSAMTKSTT